jgi:hypothetical protein
MPTPVAVKPALKPAPKPALKPATPAPKPVAAAPKSAVAAPPKPVAAAPKPALKPAMKAPAPAPKPVAAKAVPAPKAIPAPIPAAEVIQEQAPEAAAEVGAETGVEAGEAAVAQPDGETPAKKERKPRVAAGWVKEAHTPFEGNEANYIVSVLSKNEAGEITAPPAKRPGKAPYLRFMKYVDGALLSDILAQEGGPTRLDVIWDEQHQYIQLIPVS